jgi:glutaredoxin 3
MSNKQAVVWSQPKCAWCDRAIALLTEQGYEIQERKIATQQDKLDFFDQVPGARTVPQVILNGVLVGGFDKLKEHLSA